MEWSSFARMYMSLKPVANLWTFVSLNVSGSVSSSLSNHWTGPRSVYLTNGRKRLFSELSLGINSFNAATC